MKSNLIPALLDARSLDEWLDGEMKQAELLCLEINRNYKTATDGYMQALKDVRREIGLQYYEEQCDCC